MNKMTRVQKKRIKRRRFFRTLLLMIVFIIFFKLLRESNYFEIKSIEVKGNNHIKKEFVQDKSNINPNVNIFKVSVLKSRKNIEEIPYVKDVTVKRKFPNKIIINITERTEIVQFKNNNKFINIDNDGIILDIIDKERKNLVLIEGFEFKDVITKKNIGEQVNQYIKNIDDEEFLGSLMKIEILNRFKEIKLSKDKKINLITSENKLIEFGNIYDSEYKFKLLGEIFVHIEEENIEYTKIIMDKGENPVIVTEKVGG